MPIATLPQKLLTNAAATPEKTALTFLHPGLPAETITYAQLVDDARQVGAYLRAQNITPGTLVIIALDHGYAPIKAFWGALFAGALPNIFPYYGQHKNTAIYQERLIQLLQAAGPAAIVTTAEYADVLEDLVRSTRTPVLDIEVATATAFSANRLTELPIDPHSDRVPAYLQFSSGTTGIPKGALISHAAALSNLTTFNKVTRYSAESVCVGWLPFYHDMGLGSLTLGPLMAGASAVSLPPQSWLRRPRTLFQAVHDYRGTHTWMPNFGFSHCARHVAPEDLQGLDLSSWIHVGNGSEMISIDTLNAFSAHFAPCGLDPLAVTTGWGMAENVLWITINSFDRPISVEHVPRQSIEAGTLAQPQPEPTANTISIVGCGVPHVTTEIAVLGPEGITQQERMIGELLLRGDSLFIGYYPDPTAGPKTGLDAYYKVADARDLPQNPNLDADGWFHTGDLGYLVEGQVFICGRIKDLIIAGGENILPETIESVARRQLGTDGRRCAAFGIPHHHLGTEVPVMVCELKGARDEETQLALIATIRLEIQRTLGVNLADLRLVRSGWVQVTTSGKIARAHTKAKYLSEFGTPFAAQFDITRTDRMAILASLMAEMLQQPVVGYDDDFFELGGDSLAATRLALEIESLFGVAVPGEFFETATVRNLSQLMQAAEQNS
ncbi:MAG: non-ribosomal peptide synthetase [Litorilinea sp.]